MTDEFEELNSLDNIRFLAKKHADNFGYDRLVQFLLVLIFENSYKSQLEFGEKIDLQSLVNISKEVALFNAVGELQEENER